MSFFKALFSLFGDSKKEEQVNPVALPQRISDKIAQEKIDPYQQAARDTLKLVNMPDEIKQKIVDSFAEINLNQRDIGKKISEIVLEDLEGVEWNWIEWDFWSKKCVELDLCPYNMPWPLPDVLDFEYEREKYSPEKVFNVMTLKTAKERLTNFPETTSMKKVEIIEFLKSNPDAWNAVIDPHIEKIWNGKKHHEGATPKVVLECLLDTINRRGLALYDAQRIWRLRGKTIEDSAFDNDKKLLEIARADPATPWKKNYGHPVPGGDVMYIPEFPKSKYEK